MTLSEFIEFCDSELLEIRERRERTATIRILLEDIAGLDYSQQQRDRDVKLSTNQVKGLQEAVNRVKRGEPVQYVTGKVHFYNLILKVTPAVLIPRPETEELVDWVVKDHRSVGKNISILDIGTGSGCIALALKKTLPETRVEALDSNNDAIKLARQNGEQCDLAVEWLHMDFTNSKSWSSLGQYDVIVSNPPYIPWKDSTTLNSRVLDYEPADALFVPDNDPLLFYRLVELLARSHLKVGGRIYLEINEENSAEVLNIFSDSRYKDASCKEDLNKKPRMVRVLSSS